MEILVVLLIALIIFGPKRIPELGQSLGKGIREFKASLEGSDEQPAKGKHGPTGDGGEHRALAAADSAAPEGQPPSVEARR